MYKTNLIILLLIVSISAIGQNTGIVDKKTKEFFITATKKSEYKIFGYQYPNITTRKMICFSTYTYDVSDNLNKCPLGSYFDTGTLREGDRIVYLGTVGTYAKMNYISGSGKKTLFYMPKNSFTFK